MNQTDLSKSYFNACERMHQYVTAFYDECMHDAKGEPINDLEYINKGIAELRQSMNIEIDLIRELSKEVNE